MRQLRFFVFAWSFLTVFALAPKCATAATVGGTLTSNTTWSGSVIVLSNVIVPSGLALTVQAGTSVLLTNGVSITAQAGGTIDVRGAAASPVSFLPMNGNNAWGNISASGNNS